MNSRRILILLSVIFALGAAAGGIYMAVNLSNRYKMVKSLAEVTTAPSDEAENTLLTESGADGVIDFEALKKINGDIYAWLYIPDSDIDYPILRSEISDDYYLTHDWTGAEDEKGAVYTELYNKADFSDFMTVVYGHMVDTGEIFGKLLDYKDRDFFDAHRKIVVFTPDKTFIYDVFAAYTGGNEHLLLLYTFFTDRSIRTDYIEAVRMLRSMDSIVDTEVPLDADSNILTLSCCTYNEGERFLVQAVLTQ